MCEPLRGKEIKLTDVGSGAKDRTWCDDVYRCFKSEDVKSAVEFYKKYMNDIYSFKEEHPDLFNEFIKWIYGEDDLDKILNEYISDMDYFIAECINDEGTNHFHIWLFDYCFGDVIDD